MIRGGNWHSILLGLFRHFHMQTCRAMTRFAADVDFRPRCLIRIALRVVVFLQVGRVAISAHEVPVLPCIGPVKLIGCGRVWI